jgi:hypothetical protein
MVSAVGGTSYASGTPCPSCAGASGNSVAALQGRLRQAQMQLEDWATCVSSKTVKGQTAIQKLSGEISATKEQIARALQSGSGALPHASASAKPQTQTSPAVAKSNSPDRGSTRSVDVWA